MSEVSLEHTAEARAALNAIVTDPEAAVKRGTRNRRMSSIGSAARRSHATNVPSSAAVSAKPPSVRAAPQPYSGASMIV